MPGGANYKRVQLKRFQACFYIDGRDAVMPVKEPERNNVGFLSVISFRLLLMIYFTLIFIVKVFLLPFFKVIFALIVAVPAFFPVIFPFFDTLAIDFFVDV